MKEILIRFCNETRESPSEFLSNPFDVYIDGEKIPRLKRIEIDFKKYEPDQHVCYSDDFSYKVEQYVDVFNIDD